ncbi:MAG TPA: signal peptidase I [Armatimonadetes bacterium]|nr:signal peptidase I [Armatimonadota bacterium]MCA1997120.1 signal peptidase I [Armatimonadota bacterium]HCE00366.1 signal peptidase I [Armatimonadota bacterium]
MRKMAITGFGLVLVMILVLAVLFYANFRTVVVSGPSMEPTFKSGDRLLASRAYWLVGPIQKKDIVVVKPEGSSTYVIKRVAYMPGETVDYQNIPDNWPLTNGPYKVPEGKVYLLGDNWANSEDSRKYGPVSESAILGKIVVLPTMWQVALKVLLATAAAFFIALYALERLRSSGRSSPESAA